MNRFIPESCETCRYCSGCDLRFILAKNDVTKCQNYIMSDECRLCEVCPDMKCFNFGTCLPVQEVLF